MYVLVALGSAAVYTPSFFSYTVIPLSHFTVTAPVAFSGFVAVKVTVPAPRCAVTEGLIVIVGVALTILKFAVPISVSPTFTVAVATPTLVLFA